MKQPFFFKIMSIIIVFVMIMTFAACGAQSGQSSDTASSGSSASVSSSAAGSAVEEKADPFGKYEPAIEVTATRKQPTGLTFVDGETLDNNKIIKIMYEDQLGIKLKYLWTVPEAQFDQKMSVSIAADDLPDLMVVNAKYLRMLADSDKIMDITTVFDKYASDTVKACYEGDKGLSFDLGKIDGKLMAIPQTASLMTTPSLVWLRHDWLTNLNLPEPKTMDDVLAIMDAFVNGDPDKNGKKDTYGMGLEKNFGPFAGLEGFFNSYHAYPNSWIKDSSGDLVYGVIQPEVRTALLKLQDLYKVGIIDKEFGVKDVNKVAEDTTAGKIGLEYGYVWNPAYPLQDSMNKDPKADWRPYPILSSDDRPVAPSVSIDTSNMEFLAVNKNAKHPEAAVKLVNAATEESAGFLFGDEKYKEVIPKAVDDEYQAKGVNQAWIYRLFTLAPADKDMTAHFMLVDMLDGKKPVSKVAQSVYDQIKAYEQDGNRATWGYAYMYGHIGSYQTVNQYYKEPKNYMMNEFYGTPTKTMITKWSTLSKMQLEVFTKIIMGNSIESYDKFVNDWKKLGGDDITREVNEWYHAK